MNLLCFQNVASRDMAILLQKIAGLVQKEKKYMFSGEETSVGTKGARFEAGGQHTRKNQLVSCDVG